MNGQKTRKSFEKAVKSDFAVLRQLFGEIKILDTSIINAMTNLGEIA